MRGVVGNSSADGGFERKNDCSKQVQDKKGGRECRQQQGDERVENTENHSQQHHSLELVKGAVDAVYELPKKRAVPPAPRMTHPSPPYEG